MGGGIDVVAYLISQRRQQLNGNMWHQMHSRLRWLNELIGFRCAIKPHGGKDMGILVGAIVDFWDTSRVLPEKKQG